jgi:hypothetical protein
MSQPRTVISMAPVTATMLAVRFGLGEKVRRGLTGGVAPE